MTYLEHINGPQDLKGLTQDQLAILASEIRDVLVESVTRTSGHLGPNLGVVELTMAMHRVFDSPKDKLIFDTGHQSYVHKLLTGRFPEFHTLRQTGGLSGYPSRAELLWRAGDVLSAVASGQLNVRIGLEYSLAHAPQAHEDLAARRTTGKLILVP